MLWILQLLAYSLQCDKAEQKYSSPNTGWEGGGGGGGGVVQLQNGLVDLHPHVTVSLWFQLPENYFKVVERPQSPSENLVSVWC